MAQVVEFTLDGHSIHTTVCVIHSLDQGRAIFCIKHGNEKNFKALGAIREDHTIKCPLRPSKSIEKKERGFFDHRSDNYVSIEQ